MPDTFCAAYSGAEICQVSRVELLEGDVSAGMGGGAGKAELGRRAGDVLERM